MHSPYMLKLHTDRRQDIIDLIDIKLKPPRPLTEEDTQENALRELTLHN